MSFARSKSTRLSILTAPLLLALSDPKVTGPLLVALIYFPEKLQARLPRALHALLTSPKVIRTLKIALGVGLLRKLNDAYSRYTVNNWKKDARFIKSQEVVLITGGCSGIGQLMAKQFAEKGVKVVVMDINAPKDPLPANIYFYQADVTSQSQIASVAAEIRRDHGDPTVLINNAGIGTGTTILGGDDRMVEKTFQVNTMAHFWMVREFLPAMIAKDHGHVVTIASMASYIVHAGNVDYSCTKASALAFHEGLAAELKARYKAPNVKTTVVNPGWIRTPLLEPLLASPDFKDPVLEMDEVTSKIVKQVLSGRSGQLILPAELSMASTIRSWPAWAQYAIRNRIAHVVEAPEGYEAPMHTSIK